MSNLFLYGMYIPALWYALAGFRSRRSDIDNPPAAKASERDSEDYNPDSHDNELHDIPDNLRQGSNGRGHCGLSEAFRERGTGRLPWAARNTITLPLPGKMDQGGLSVAEAEEEEALRFTPTEVLLYQHAQDRRYA